MNSTSCELRVAGCELGQLRRNRCAFSRLACEALSAPSDERDGSRKMNRGFRGFQSVSSAPSAVSKNDSPLATRNPQLATAFTLTEILIVIGLIVLILVLAVPALDFITGSNSTDAAQNQISAMLGRARTEAIGVQEPVGVFFFKDDATGRMTMGLVADDPASTDDQFIDLLADRDEQSLPLGVGVQLINSGNDRYLNFGVILFDGFGRVLSRDYGILQGSNLGTRLQLTNNLAPLTSDLFSQLGFVAYQQEQFINQPVASERDVDFWFPSYPTNPAGADEVEEEEWLDNNALPILVNRYNGTLVKGE